MKKRKFYPRQVLKSLEGLNVQDLDAGRKHALQYFLLNSRKLNQQIALLNSASPAELLAATSKEQADAIMQNSGTKIFLKMPVVDVGHAHKALI